MISGGKLLIKTLHEHRVRRVFSVAGESYLPALDAFEDFPDIELITNRQESGATFAAEAYGLLTGKPGVAFVTRGPGACNASIGVHAAKQSSSPMILFVGLVRTEDREKEAFQEFDLPQMFASHTKWAAVIDKADRIGEMTARAFHIATSGRPGPVVLGLPEEILSEMVMDHAPAPCTVHGNSFDPTACRNVINMLAEAKKPLAIIGGSGWSDEACADFLRFAVAAHLPVCASFRRQDLIDHNSGCYVGELGTGTNPKLVQSVKDADVILVIGARINEIMTQSYTLFEPGQRIIHIYPSSDEMGKAYAPEMGVVSDNASAAAALAASRLNGRAWAQWKKALRDQYLDWSDIATESENWNGADMTQIFRQLRETLPQDAIITTDAGNFSGWCQRYIRYGRPARLLAPISGAMGYAIPSAISASLEYSNRLVLGVCGDGGFMMTQVELATAVHHGAKPIIFVCNNSMYGTIRMHQNNTFPGRSPGTGLTNPDFVALAQSYGAYAARIDHADQFKKIWGEAVASERLALIEVRMDPRQITTNARISNI